MTSKSITYDTRSIPIDSTSINFLTESIGRPRRLLIDSGVNQLTLAFLPARPVCLLLSDKIFLISPCSPLFEPPFHVPQTHRRKTTPCRLPRRKPSGSLLKMSYTHGSLGGSLSRTLVILQGLLRRYGRGSSLHQKEALSGTFFGCLHFSRCTRWRRPRRVDLE